MEKTPVGQADLHMHTTYSDGCATVEEVLHHCEHRTNLHVIAITDHDCIQGALKARDIALKNHMHIEVIPGIEISTRDGHLLALNVEKLIPRNLSMSESIQAVHEQGGLAIVAHPLNQWCHAATYKTLASLVNHCPDGVEIHNASLSCVASNLATKTVNNMYFNWARAGSSTTHFEGSSISDLMDALRRKKTVAVSGYWPAKALAGYGYHALSNSAQQIKDYVMGFSA